jgi:hypothetical protein
MTAPLQKMFDLGFRAGKFSLPNDYFAGERGRSGHGEPLERLEWRAGHANQKNRRNTITSGHSCNRTEPAGGDKLKCSASPSSAVAAVYDRDRNSKPVSPFSRPSAVIDRRYRKIDSARAPNYSTGADES